MRRFGFVFLMIISFVSLAQPDDAVTKQIDGKKFYVHTVQQGNTLYGIQQLYKVEMSRILENNPNISDNLIIGQQILIPASSEENSNGSFHIVESGETLYGISKKYNCSVQELKKLNPGIENGIQIGQKVQLPIQNSADGEVIQNDPEIETPVYNISYQDSIVRHTVLDHETLYSISKRYMVNADTIKALNNIKGNKVRKGDVILIPIKNVNYQVLEKQINPIIQDSTIQGIEVIKKEVYSIAVMLPFMFAQNDAEMSKSIKIGQHREMFPTTQISFEFYQGFIMAIDSLKKAGLSVNVYAYDTKKDTNVISKIFEKAEFQDMDLVIGPLYPQTIKYTASRCKNIGLKIILPFKTDAGILHENKYAFKAVTSNMTLIDGSVDYLIAKHAHHNIVILKPYLESDNALYERARDRFNSNIPPGSYNSKIVELGLGSSSGRDMNAVFKKDTVNFVIIPSNDVKFVTGALNRLNKILNMNPYAKKMKIIAVGFEDWNKFDDIDVLHRNRLNQHYSTYRYVDYNSEHGLKFVRTFRAKTGVDPTVYSSQGFDIGMYFMSAMHLYGLNFEPELEFHAPELVQNEFRFKSISENSGYENISSRIIKYENFELIICE